MNQIKKILYIGSHLDDIEIGCGGTLIKNLKKKNYFLILTDSEYKNKNKTIRTKESAEKSFKKIRSKIKINNFKILNNKTNNLLVNDDLVLSIRNYIDRVKPDLIFTHWTGDAHHDHRAAGLATLSAARHIKNIMMYRSNIYKTNVLFKANFFVDITKEYKKKIQLIKIYSDEMKRTNYKWLKFLEYQNKIDGFKNNTQYCEGFEIVRFFQK
jgi:LmbE family N-acetylglucosaminyl deacetylase